MYVRVLLMEKLITPFALAATLALAGCGAGTANAPSATAGSSAPESSAAEEAPEAPDLTGEWKQSNTNSEDSYQQASITSDTITIEWVTDGGNTTSIYWVGTFEAPTDASESYTWTSERDAEATDSSLLGSTSDTKDFMYEGETISYEVTALGTTTTVEMKKE